MDKREPGLQEHAGAVPRKLKTLKAVYGAVMTLLVSVVILTPLLITGGIALKRDVFMEEELLEVLLIAFLLVTGVAISSLYRNSLRNYQRKLDKISFLRDNAEERLMEAFQYIGAVNVQLGEIRSLLSSFNRYPEDRREFRNSLMFLAKKALSVASVEWVVFRIIETESLRTVREFGDTRGDAAFLKSAVSNRSIVETGAGDGWIAIGSNQDNLTIRVFCVIPSKELTPVEKELLETIVNTIEMLFVIFTSQFYRKSYYRNGAAGGGHGHKTAADRTVSGRRLNGDSANQR
jgi:hypothetical protein